MHIAEDALIANTIVIHTVTVFMAGMTLSGVLINNVYYMRLIHELGDSDVDINKVQIVFM